MPTNVGWPSHSHMYNDRTPSIENTHIPSRLHIPITHTSSSKSSFSQRSRTQSLRKYIQRSPDLYCGFIRRSILPLYAHLSCLASIPKYGLLKVDLGKAQCCVFKVPYMSVWLVGLYSHLSVVWCKLPVFALVKKASKARAIYYAPVCTVKGEKGQHWCFLWEQARELPKAS